MKKIPFVFLILLLITISLIQPVFARTISFAGYNWSVKSTNGTGTAGPGPNHFGGGVSNVWADSSGLHMTISQSGGYWWCTEIFLPSSLGYGTYLFNTRGRFDLNDVNMVAGFFTYENDTREMDMEFSRWGDSGYPVEQYSVQPVPPSSNNHAFDVDLTDADQDLTLIMTWSKGTVTMRTYHGHHTLDYLPASDLIDAWTNISSYVPPAGAEKYRINFWLMSGLAPSNGTGAEFVITNFKYYPLSYKPNPPSRYLYCWSTESITNNMGTARSDFYSFCTAPFGDPSKANTGLYYSSYSDITGNPANLRGFLTDAHSKGFKIMYLDGDPNWVSSSANRISAEGIVDAVLSFNMAGNSTQRFDGIQYDIEPTSLPGWAGNESTYWSTFTTLLINCQSKVTAYNVSYTPTMYFEETIPWSYDSDGDPITSSAQIQSIVDSVAILDYVNDSTGIINKALGEVTYGDAHGKKVIVGVDTRNIAPASSTFYGLGNPFMETQLAPVDNTFSSHSSYRGIAIQYYDSYKSLQSGVAINDWSLYAETEESSKTEKPMAR